MTVYEKLTKIGEIYERLQDEESRQIFQARVSLMIDGDRIAYWNRIKEKEWYSFHLQDESYLIFGAGKMGLHIREQLEMIGKKVVAFLENDHSKVGHVIKDVPVISVKDAAQFKNIPIVFSSRLYESEMEQQLNRLKILNPTVPEAAVCLFCGTQYFDVFDARKDEVFVDAGAYDGGTVRDFIRWCGGNYNMIYSFEPDEANYLKCKELIEREQIERIQLIRKGTYDRDMNLNFDASGDGGASITESGSSVVEVTSIDAVLNGAEATFLKMDVEGSELKSLYGARKTIERYRPRLAICVYHKILDFIEIPLLLLEMNPSYRFYLRHYASNLCETVLYAQ